MTPLIRQTISKIKTAIFAASINPREQRAFSASGRIAVAGIFSKHCGLQRAADLHFIHLRSSGVDVQRYDVTSLTGHNPDLKRADTKEWTTLKADAPNAMIIHAPAPIIAALLKRLGQRFYEQTIVISFWHWETPRAPNSWRTTANLLDEIWVPTPFVFDAVRATIPELTDRLRIVQNPVEADPFPHLDQAERKKAKQHLGIPGDTFVVAFTFSAGSCFTRKNPVAALDAFSLAFPIDTPNVRFLMRCNDLHTYPWGESILRKRADQDQRIILSCGETAVPIRKFYAATDTLLSLHRSEGYGLTIAEAAQSGTRVIATEWGLAPELRAMPGVSTVRYTLVPLIDPQGFYCPANGAVWADANLLDAASLLQSHFESFSPR
jgi:glycosyltransferase involved in cell wall biosynthesis